MAYLRLFLILFFFALGSNFLLRIYVVYYPHTVQKYKDKDLKENITFSPKELTPLLHKSEHTSYISNLSTTKEPTTTSMTILAQEPPPTTMTILETSPPAREEATTYMADDKSCDPSKQRIIVFARHARRLTRGIKWETWLNTSFDKNGNYKPKDPMLPQKVHKRKGGLMQYFRDPPLYGTGYINSIDLGKTLRSVGIRIHHAYSSYPLRCLETTEGILEGNWGSVPPETINMECGFHERDAEKTADWYMTKQELNNAGYHVNMSYAPYGSYGPETFVEMHKRIFNTTLNLLEKHKEGNILIVGHCNTGENTMHLMTGLPVPANATYWRKIRNACNVLFLNTTIFQETCDETGYNWKRLEFPEIRHSFDWHCLTDVLDMDGSLRRFRNGTWIEDYPLDPHIPLPKDL